METYLEKHLRPRSDLVSFLNQVNFKGRYLCRHVWAPFVYQVVRVCRHHDINTLNAELNPICHLLTLLEAHPILHISRIKVKGAKTFGFVLIQFIRQ